MRPYACASPPGLWCPVETWSEAGFAGDRRPASVTVHVRYTDDDSRYRCGVCGLTFLVEQLPAAAAAGHAWPATCKEHLMVEVAWCVTCASASPYTVARRVGVDGATAKRWVKTVLERFRAEGRNLCAVHDAESVLHVRDRRFACADPGARARDTADARWYWSACAAEVLHRLHAAGHLEAIERDAAWTRLTGRAAIGSEPWATEMERLLSLCGGDSEA